MTHMYHITLTYTVVNVLSSKCSSEGNATDVALSSTPVNVLTVILDSIFKNERYDTPSIYY